MKKITYVEVIDYIVNYYSEDINRRSFNENGHCSYNGLNGNKCAFALCSKDIDPIHEGRSASHILTKIDNNILLDKYKHLTDDLFWDKIQSLHDGDFYWDLENSTLSSEGFDYVEKLKIDYKN